MVFGGIVSGFGGSLDDRVELEGGRYEDEGDVKDFGGHAIAYYANVVGFACHVDGWVCC